MKFVFLILCCIFLVPAAHARTATASWYGAHWAGRHTANGERFNPHAFTAASKTLPMGTRLLVKRGSKSVVVRINDRGPYVKGRSLDLSHAAAKRLGMINKGVSKIQYTILSSR